MFIQIAEPLEEGIEWKYGCYFFFFPTIITIVYIVRKGYFFFERKFFPFLKILVCVRCFYGINKILPLREFSG